MSEPSQDPPKIIVDDDWKAQVEKEKQAAAAAAAADAGAAKSGEADSGTAAASDAPASEPQASSSPATAKTSGGSAAGTAEDAPPPATFEMLITMLFTQAMAALGQLPDPSGQMGPVNKPFAKYFIDTVELLGEKTKGNLSPDESKMISEALHAMRMAFVSVKAK